jgi:hypothetical protein
VNTSTPSPRRWWNNKGIVIPAAVLTVAIVAAASVITNRRHDDSTGTSSGPGQVAVDTAGNVYFVERLSDTRGRVLKLPTA